MNEAQIDKELKKERRKLASATKARENYGGISAEERALRESFPLGTGGFNRREVEKRSGELSERVVNRGKKLESAMERQKDAQGRIDRLEKAKKEIKGTGKTQKEVRAEALKKAAESAPAMKWKTTQKEERTSTGLRAQIIKSGDYEIVGKGFVRIMRNGQEIATASGVKSAKDFVAAYEARRRKKR